MSENKRFVMYEHKDNDYILDSPNTSLDFIEMLGDALSSEEIVDLLNKQEEEIQKLEKENQNLKQMMENFVNKDAYWEKKAKQKIQELEERNKRQYDRLKELTELMYEKQWEKLENMVEEWGKQEKLLNQEWSNCGDE